MKTKLFLLLLVLPVLAFANTDKYRLILLDNPSSTITIGWNQVSGNNPVVYYGTTDYGTNYSAYSYSKTVDRSVDYKSMDSQFARLNGLTPNTAYYFVIRDSQGTSQRFWFKTAPADNSRLSFIAGGDSRNNRSPRRSANSLVSKLKPHAVFFGGDMTDNNSSSQWEDWLDDWQLTTASDGRMFPIVPARGNHESDNSIHNLFDTKDEDAYYAMTWGNNLIRSYTLNTEISVSGNQLNWLQNDLRSSRNLNWKMAQYHKPMRPHTSGKSEGNSEYSAWAKLFFDEKVRLVVDSDSHTAKTTWPVEPSSASGNDEGFIRNNTNGTVYTGEGCWGAPLRSANDTKNWTRNSGSFNQFKLIFVSPEKIELRTIKVDNASSVAEGSNTNPFLLPQNLDVFSPSTGAVVVINNNNVIPPCPIAGTTCDDGDSNTVRDEQDGRCNCVGTPTSGTLQYAVNQSSDDAEERLSSGSVSTTSSDLELISDGSNQLVGIRFRNVDFPQNATVTGAYVQFGTDETGSTQTNLKIHGELSGNSSTFTTSTRNISSRPKTNSFINWSNIAAWQSAGQSGTNQRTPDLSSVVSEIITQPTWNSGNSVTLLISGSGKRTAESYNGSSQLAPKLVIEFAANIACLPVGTTCNDGDSGTINDQEDGNCNCSGEPAPCPVAGTACNDGDTSTINDQEDGNCNCSGEPAPCPVAGTTCDDGNSSTINDKQDGNCNCIGTPAPITETYEYSINRASDDAEEKVSSRSVSLNSSDLELVYDRGNQIVGLRFTNIEYPQNANVTKAYIQFGADERNSGQTNLVFHAQLSSNSSTFSSSSGNISSRPKTSNSVNWSNLAAWQSVGESGTKQKSPDLSSIVSEVIAQPGWNSGNSITFLISGTGERTAESYNGTRSLSPKLVLELSSGGSCPVAGTACNDGDSSTINDQQDGNCNCAGTAPACPVAGTACNDGDSSTINDQQDGNCNCAGTPPACPVAGTACNDGDSSTINDQQDGNCNCVGILPAPVSQTFEYTINKSSDDAEERLSNRSVSLYSSDLELVYDGGNQLIGIRYENIEYPQNLTVSEAYIQFGTDETGSTQTNLLIQGELSANSRTFTSGYGNISSRTRTNNSTSWSNIAPWLIRNEKGTKQRSPDLSNIVNEIITQPSWNSGNSITFLISGTGKRVAESFNGTRSLSPKLVLKFTNGNQSQSRSSEKSNVFEQDEIILYPNPFSNVLNIKSGANESINSIQIRAISGRLVNETLFSTKPKNAQITLSDLPSGVYFAIIKTDKAEYQKKIVKK